LITLPAPSVKVNGPDAAVLSNWIPLKSGFDGS
jgi:hypothetical protein